MFTNTNKKANSKNFSIKFKKARICPKIYPNFDINIDHMFSDQNSNENKEIHRKGIILCIYNLTFSLNFNLNVYHT